jgi:hypothetical protein
VASGHLPRLQTIRQIRSSAFTSCFSAQQARCHLGIKRAAKQLVERRCSEHRAEEAQSHQQFHRQHGPGQLAVEAPAQLLQLPLFADLQSCYWRQVSAARAAAAVIDISLALCLTLASRAAWMSGCAAAATNALSIEKARREANRTARNTYSTHMMSHHTIPHHTTPYHTIPHHTIPHHTTPYHTTPYHTIPYHTTISYDIISCHIEWVHARLTHSLTYPEGVVIEGHERVQRRADHTCNN